MARMVRLLFLVVALLSFSLAADAKPRPKAGSGKARPRASSSLNRHDGFFWRSTTGLGYARSIHSETSDIYWHGLALIGDEAIGWSVIENLSISLNNFFSYQVVATCNPGSQDALLISHGIGLGPTWYFKRANAYLGAAFGVAFQGGVAIGASNATFTMAKPGFGMEVIGGKEWWVSQNWGVGIAGQLIYMYVPDEFTITPGSTKSFGWNTVSFGLLFSATYN